MSAEWPPERAILNWTLWRCSSSRKPRQGIGAVQSCQGKVKAKCRGCWLAVQGGWLFRVVLVRLSFILLIFLFSGWSIFNLKFFLDLSCQCSGSALSLIAFLVKRWGKMKEWRSRRWRWRKLKARGGWRMWRRSSAAFQCALEQWIIKIKFQIKYLKNKNE